MSKSSILIGFSISPTHIGAVRLSADDYSVECHFHKALPPAILSHDARRVLDVPTLVPILRDLLIDLGSPDFSVPIFLSIHTPFIATQNRHFSETDSLKALLQQDVEAKNLLKDDPPLLQHALLWQHGETALVTYAVIGSELVKDFSEAFYQAGHRVTAVDLIPLSVLRGIAASGLADALLQKAGLNATWGCFGICGSQTWVTLLQGAHVVYMTNFTTPADKADWSKSILESAASANIEKPVLWFAWEEKGTQHPIDPLKLDLKAPIRPAVLGPFYGPPQGQPSIPALGAALKEEIPFPFDWDFLTDPNATPLQTHYEELPYVHYKPVLPRLFLIFFILLFLVTSGATGYFWMQNKQVAQTIHQQDTQIQTLFSEASQQNKLYSDVFQTIQNKTIDGIQIEQLHLASPDQLNLSGKAYDANKIQQFLALLITPDNKLPLKIQQIQHGVHAVNSTPASFQFNFSGKVVSADKKGHPTS